MLVRHHNRVEELTTVPNTDGSRFFSNACAALKRGLPELAALPWRPHPAVLCGGGPSLTDADSLEKIRKLKEAGGLVYALNNAAKTLCEHGIRPDFQIVLDARPENVEFVREDWADAVLIASQCDAGLFDAALARKASLVVFNHGAKEIGESLKTELGREATPLMVGGSHTVGLVAMSIAYTAGHNLMHLFGYDSSHREGKSHAYRQDMNARDELLEVVAGGKAFVASLAMASQARAFPEAAQQLTELGCTIHVHGDGLLPAIAKMTEEMQAVKPLTAIYDLSIGPGTFEFFPFLCEAERYRKEFGFTCIDMLFVPGHCQGHREDNIRLIGKEALDGMLQRICVNGARLLPSVRNIHFYQEKPEKVEGELFPPMWGPERPVGLYGPEHFVNGERALTATPAAKAWQRKRYAKPYVTITMREAAYWLGRNSNLKNWLIAAEHLEEHGYDVVFVPDADGHVVDGFHNCTEASQDIDLRMALYEGAALNLGVSNGPMALCYLSNAKYIVFKMLPEDGSPITRAFYNARGMEVGAQWGPNGKVVWEADSVENILRELDSFFVQSTPLTEA